MPDQNDSSATAMPRVQASITALLERALDHENLSIHNEYYAVLETYAQERGRSHDADSLRADDVWDSLKEALPPSKHALLEELEALHHQMRTTEAEAAFELGRRVAIALARRAPRDGGESPLAGSTNETGDAR